MQKLHFISGLPRSGSTLLSAILKQNPRFTAGISDPLADITNNIISTINGAVGMNVQVPPDKQREIIRIMFDTFYNHSNQVCFNTNRGWTAQTALLRDLFPTSKMIVCIRDVGWVLDSFEQLQAKNPYTLKPIYNHQNLVSVYDRTRMLMGDMPNFGGYVMSPLYNTKQSMYSNEKDMLCVVEYDQLVKNPKESMQQIYQFLNESWYEHDFNNVEDSYDEFDEHTKIKGLHTIKKVVEYTPRKPILPEDLWTQYSALSYWKNNFDHIKKQMYWVK
jgi:sulfotransferase